MSADKKAARRARAMEVLAGVLDADEDRRPAVLDELCAGDDLLRREVESLLAFEDEVDAFLAEPAISDPRLTDLPAFEPDDLESGTRLGHYRVVELIGRGGMGSVYLAARAGDFDKQVAVKLVHRGLGSRGHLRRFHAERQILARLEYPAIARLIDGGTTDDGRPYLVMEYVKGRRVDHYCDVHRLSIRRRLELFLEILAAVAFAHRNLVVHRDVKPANILVTEAGEPKLLDFGIAKLVDQDDPPAEASRTATGRPLTPLYASPEQVRGEALITTAGDVYSLGVLLYELLTGHLPCDLETCPTPEVLRRVCEVEPRRPSAVVGEDAVASRMPGGSLGKLRRRIAGDLDVIVLKALRKEPGERYASVERLAEDLRRHLDGLPIQARRGAWAYRAGKLARRYKWAVAALVLVLASSVMSTVLWREAVAARQRSDLVLALLEDSMHLVNPDDDRDPREILDEGRAVLTAVRQADPELGARLSMKLAEEYRDLGLHEDALELLEITVKLRRELHPGGDSKLATAINDLAGEHYYLENYAAATAFFREALAMRRRLGRSEGDIALVLSNLASALRQEGQLDEAEALYREALAVREQVYAPGNPRIAASLYALGVLTADRGDLETAQDHLRRALTIRVAAFGERHTQVASLQNTLGRVLHALGRLAEAEDLQRRALDIRRRRPEAEADRTALVQRDLAAVLLDRGRTEEAGNLLAEARAILHDSEDWTVASVESVLGAYLAAVGRYNEAESYLRASHAVILAAKGEVSLYTRQAEARLALLTEAGSENK